MRRYIIFIFITAGLLSCDRNGEQYSDIPEVEYQSFTLYYEIDNFGQRKLSGDLLFNFIDGDGNIGLHPLLDTLGIGLPDTLLYNLFLQLHDYQGNAFVEISEAEGGFYKYRIPYLDKKPLRGSITIKIDYPIIKYDTVFYTFYLYDRAFNRSNTDSTEVIIFTGIELDSIRRY